MLPADRRRGDGACTKSGLREAGRRDAHGGGFGSAQPRESALDRKGQAGDSAQRFTQHVGVASRDADKRLSGT